MTLSLMPVAVVVALKGADRAWAPRGALVLLAVLFAFGLVSDAADLVADDVPEVVYAS